MFHLIRPDTNFDYLGKSKPFIWLSTILAVVSVVLLFAPGLNYGVDFTGGAVIQLKVPADWNTAKLRSELTQGGVKDPTIVQLGEASEHEFFVKVQASADELNRVSAAVEKVMDASAGVGQYVIQKTDIVGPAAGASLRKSAFLSILYSILCITIYITFRFDFRYAPGVMRALGVDVIITLGMWVLLQREFNLTVLAAILTIAGYSCNDTIVIYDRIRDYTHAHPDWPLEKAVNRSINQNFSRTLITTGSTLMVVVSLFFLGGPVLQDFALPLMIGFAVSVPSTIFVATPMIIFMEKRRIARHAKMSGQSAASSKARL